MTKPFKIFLIIAVLLVTSWFVQIIPWMNFQKYGIVGCKSVELRTLNSFILPSQSNISPIFRTAKVEKPKVIFIFGSCEIVG